MFQRLAPVYFRAVYYYGYYTVPTGPKASYASHMPFHGLKAHFFLALNNISLSVYTTVCPFTIKKNVMESSIFSLVRVTKVSSKVAVPFCHFESAHQKGMSHCCSTSSPAFGGQCSRLWPKRCAVLSHCFHMLTCHLFVSSGEVFIKF